MSLSWGSFSPEILYRALTQQERNRENLNNTNSCNDNKPKRLDESAEMAPIYNMNTTQSSLTCRKASTTGAQVFSKKYGAIRVIVAETAAYERKEIIMQVIIDNGRARCGFFTSSPRGSRTGLNMVLEKIDESKFCKLFSLLV